MKFEIQTLIFYELFDGHDHGLRTPRVEKAFTARPKFHSHSHWVSVVRGVDNLRKLSPLKTKHVFVMCPLRTKHVSVDIIKAPYYPLMLS